MVLTEKGVGSLFRSSASTDRKSLPEKDSRPRRHSASWWAAVEWDTSRTAVRRIWEVIVRKCQCQPRADIALRDKPHRLFRRLDPLLLRRPVFGRAAEFGIPVVGWALLPVNPSMTGKSARPTGKFPSARRLDSHNQGPGKHTSSYLDSPLSPVTTLRIAQVSFASRLSFP